MLTIVLTIVTMALVPQRRAFKKKKLFIWLSFGLGCIVQGLSLMCMDSLVVAYWLSCFSACGILVPQPEIKPLHHKVDS